MKQTDSQARFGMVGLRLHAVRCTLYFKDTSFREHLQGHALRPSVLQCLHGIQHVLCVMSLTPYLQVVAQARAGGRFDYCFLTQGCLPEGAAEACGLTHALAPSCSVLLHHPCSSAFGKVDCVLMGAFMTALDKAGLSLSLVLLLQT